MRIILTFYWKIWTHDRPSKGPTTERTRKTEKQGHTSKRQVEFQQTISDFERFPTGQALKQTATMTDTNEYSPLVLKS